MTIDATLAARVYCALSGALLTALGLAAWQADRANPYTGAALAGAGLFLIVGTFGRTTRLTALMVLCAVVCGFAFVAGLGYAVIALEWPTVATVRLLAMELAAGLLAAALGRTLYLEDVR
ncbi:hypothetical protein [Nevskia sp.]|uniref:hypothetical protein n=1 Tax=Nevskia sp. TaxID=1929292 RepID=UPI0025FA2CD6|nr:hypothetical protein [Nevskia sp.]